MIETSHKPQFSARLGVMAAAAAITLVVTWAFILFAKDWGRAATDDIIYHSVAIDAFARQLPRVDLSDYSSATTPGYHLVMAVFKSMGAERTALRLISSAYTIGLAALLAALAFERFRWGALVLILPFLASVYFVYSGVWLLPDNSGWLGVLAVLLLSLRPSPSWRTWLAASAVLVALVFFRQSHIWAAAALWTSAWMGPADQVPGPAELFGRFGERARRLGVALLATLPAVLVLVWFADLWGGLVPPTFQDRHQGPNPATPAFILTQAAILSVFFAPLLLPQLMALLRQQPALLIGSLALGLLAAVLPETTENAEAGRNSGWWHLAGALPAIAGRSLFILAGSAAGAVAVLTWLRALQPRDRWVLGIGLLAFIAAMSTNFASWQRYHEPMLMMLGLLAVSRTDFPSLQGSASPLGRKWSLFGCVGLTVLLGLVLAQAQRSAKPVNMDLLNRHAQPET